jgi:hypothetical protein
VPNSEGSIESDLCFEIIDRIVLDDWHADLEGEGSPLTQLASRPLPRTEEKPSALADDGITEINSPEYGLG